MKILTLVTALFLQACNSTGGLSYSNKNITVNMSEHGISLNSGSYFNFEYN